MQVLVPPEILLTMTNRRVQLPSVLGSPSEKGCPLTDIIHIYSTITLYVEPKFAEEPILGASRANSTYERYKPRFELTMTI